MLTHTHNLPVDDGGFIVLSGCRCGECDNAFWVRAAPEHQPNYCAYCGAKLVWYEDAAGARFKLSGQPLGD